MHASKASKYSFHFSLNHFHVFLYIVKTLVGNTNEIFIFTVYVGNMWFSATNKNSLKKVSVFEMREISSDYQTAVKEAEFLS